jgi:two-component system sensor histidine kinase QseC
VRHGLSPLRSLSRVLAQRQAQALDPVELGEMPSEVEPVVQALNALLARIQQMLASERRFTADAAHELRTPIAAIRMQAQVALGAGADQIGRNHALTQTLAGCDRATHLVEQLLTLSRLDDSATAPSGHTDVRELAQQVAAEVAPAALARRQSLELEAPAPCLITADTTLTAVLLRNLVDNALRYSPDGARIWVSVQRSESQVVFRVQDSGPGLYEPEMARLGERFFRVLGHEQPGSGLGWSIVRRIASVYQASIDVTRCPTLGGLSVSVSWPR